MNEIRALFYDLDNTLYPQILDVKQRIEHCAKEYFNDDAEMVKQFWLDEWIKCGPGTPDVIDRVIALFSANVGKAEILRAYRQYRTALSIEKNILDMLYNIKKRGIKQFIITNGCVETQENKIESLGIRKIFNDIIIATGVHAKPSVYWYTTLLQKYDLAPDSCISVGDWYEVDGLGSRDAGIKFFKIDDGPVKENCPDRVTRINKLTEIRRFLTYA